MNSIFHFSDWYLEWLLAIAFVGGIAAPLNYRWVSKFAVDYVLSRNLFHYVVICNNFSCPAEF